ncbi:MAG: hypothetical protein A2562_02160 [Candidatus Nealsonbacteria bacterium RIFOXYD1_FULL_39_11]|nr:MAG: hypothetical protein A2562_02160 [Candidatus Nealsonbacteria bacterium RIFOXYD1_FULL_39_11]
MPNVEIHGMGKREEANQLADKIFQLFADKPYVDEMVVTIFDTFVRDKEGDSQPFLRLANSCQDHTTEIIQKLRRLGLDVEHVQLQAFYPKQTIIAVSVNELNKFGCPHCGYRSGAMPVSGGGSGVWQCGECGKTCCVLAEGVVKSTIGFNGEYPELQSHPRRGTPAHGRPDNKPDSGGEFFRSRGIGLDDCSCFVCGTKGHPMLHNIAAFVQCKEAGERVVTMIGQGAVLDYREYEPDRVQVKVGACDAHYANLEELDRLVSSGTISTNVVKMARDFSLTPSK